MQERVVQSSIESSKLMRSAATDLNLVEQRIPGLSGLGVDRSEIA